MSTIWQIEVSGGESWKLPAGSNYAVGKRAAQAAADNRPGKTVWLVEVTDGKFCTSGEFRSRTGG